MSPVLVVEQPNYLPWIGYFDLLAQSDTWIWLDDVQYTRRDWRNRNRVANARGEVLWLTVPVKVAGRFTQRIRDVEIDATQPWARRHLATLQHCYAAAPHWPEVHDLLAGILAGGHRHLAELTIDLTDALASWLGIAPRRERSSTLGLEEVERQERMLVLCDRFQATAYLSGPTAEAYLAPAAFIAAGVELRYVVYDYPAYERGGRAFVPQLSILDPLCWLGPTGTAAYLRRHGGRWRTPVGAMVPVVGAETKPA